MARTRSQGNGRLEEALTMLIQNQASLLARVAESDRQSVETDRQLVEINRQMAETNRLNAERFARIEALLLEHSRILAEHTRILQALPETIRQKIGFKTPEPPT